MMRCALVSLVAAGLVSSGCGTDGPSKNGTTTSSGLPAQRDPAQRYTAVTTVLESPSHGPQLCLGVVNDSLPPQCGGPDIKGWDWDAVADKESRNGTTWAEVTVVGTFDGHLHADRTTWRGRQASGGRVARFFAGLLGARG